MLVSCHVGGSRETQMVRITLPYLREGEKNDIGEVVILPTLKGATASQFVRGECLLGGYYEYRSSQSETPSIICHVILPHGTELTLLQCSALLNYLDYIST